MDAEVLPPAPVALVGEAVAVFVALEGPGHVDPGLRRVEGPGRPERSPELAGEAAVAGLGVDCDGLSFRVLGHVEVSSCLRSGTRNDWRNKSTRAYESQRVKNPRMAKTAQF